ncbi:electron transfer flavoprotein subunit alpha/FixB family protein [Slackia heliotrinireducens]|uniref:electron transfer flavoprotein subunit alpha/FixB family protein n=1 Tax=Slackia heliotrinireducens TaxID=84110 RepID=UPI003315B2BB
MTVFVIAETEKGARELCAGARTMGEGVALVVPGADKAVAGVADVVYTIDVPEGAPVESIATTVIKLVADKGAAAVLVEPTRRMKVVAGKLAAANATSAIVDVNAFDGDVASNLYFGGVAVRKQKPAGNLAVYSCGAAPFGDAEATGTDAVEAVEYIPEAGVTVRSREALPPAGVDLTAAKRIVAAGRGFGSQDDLQMARDFCAAIGAELGCTRPITEAEGWMPREAYIGVSGLMLSPDVYVGIGVSGQMQHMVGINTSRLVFAVNKDKNAPIFKQADYGLVGDLNAVLPELNAKLA